MSGSDSRRIPPNRVALSLVLLLIAWLVFSFYPREKTPPPTAAPLPVAESKLRAVGLEDNANWEGLPELFAVWEGHAGWKNDKAQFAYWDQWSRSYAYFFEASRVNGKVRFREIPEPEFIEGSGSSFALIFVSEPGICMVADTDLKTESPEHPFIFFRPVPADADRFRMTDVLLRLEHERIPTGNPKINVDVRAAPLDVLKPGRKGSKPDGR